jgi:hypothetical protein
MDFLKRAGISIKRFIIYFDIQIINKKNENLRIYKKICTRYCGGYVGR